MEIGDDLNNAMLLQPREEYPTSTILPTEQIIKIGCQTNTLNLIRL